MTENEFIEELTKLGINITDKELDKFNKYYELLIDWNNKINLTGITEKKEIYLKHFYDSATLFLVAPLNQNISVCDVGSGAGFPGIVLKILFPNLDITLVDSLNKRIIFLNNVISKLNLNKIKTISARAEEYSKVTREKFDIVTARAVAPLSILLEYTVPLAKVNGFIIPMKADVKNELSNIEKTLTTLNIKLLEQKEFLLPFEKSKRTLLKFIKQTSTSLKFPRKYSEIKKRPL